MYMLCKDDARSSFVNGGINVLMSRWTINDFQGKGVFLYRLNDQHLPIAAQPRPEEVTSLPSLAGHSLKVWPFYISQPELSNHNLHKRGNGMI